MEQRTRELAETAKSLGMSEERTRQIIATALDAIITMDDHGKITGWNPQAVSTFGWSEEEAIGMKLSETIIPPAQQAAHEHGFRRFLQSGKSKILNQRLELTAVRRNGQELPVELTISPVIIKGERHFSAFVRDITLRQEAEANIRQSLAEKEMLLREIHHRVKNNLQIISGLLYFQAKKVSEPASIIIFNEARERLRSMIMVHDKLYMSRNQAEVDFADYVRSLVDELSQSLTEGHDAIRFTVETVPLRLLIGTALPAGMILVELITNILKYAYPQGTAGIAHIKFTADDGLVTLVVADEGTGLPEDFKPETANSFGWNLITSLVDQLDGTCKIARKHGTRVTVSFPGTSNQ